MGAVLTTDGPLGSSIADPQVRAEVEATIMDLVRRADAEPVWIDLLVAMTLVAHGEPGVVEKLVAVANEVAAWEFTLQHTRHRRWALEKLEAARPLLKQVMEAMGDYVRPVYSLIEGLVADYFLVTENHPPFQSISHATMMTWVNRGMLFAAFGE